MTFATSPSTSSSGSHEASQLRARAELEIRRRVQAEGLLAYVPRLSPRFQAPHHLARVAELYQRIARGEQVFAVVNLPPRHGKTELELHGVPWLLRQRPEFELCFAGYGAPFARKKSRRARDLTQRAGVPIDRGAKAVTDWRTGVEGGGMWATSVGGAVNGEGFHVALVDDPIKGRREAESAKYREAILEWFRADLITRLHPRGSCIVTQTRWHPDDLAGVLIAEGWECIRVPAIDEVVNDDGGAEERALWPERYDLASLKAIRRRVGEYNWASLYQGLPRPRGGALFREPTFYDVAPTEGRYFIGVDFAYTAKTSADYSTAVVLRESRGKLYVIEVVRMQAAAPEFGAALARLKGKYAGATVHAYVAGPEKGTVDLLNRAHPGLGIQAKPAVADKFVRAQGSAADWNAGDMPVPSGRMPGCAVCGARQCDDHKAPEWLDVYLGEVCAFTGVGDVHDDLVDATAAARDAAKGPRLSAGSFLDFGVPTRF